MEPIRTGYMYLSIFHHVSVSMETVNPVLTRASVWYRHVYIAVQIA